MADLPTTHLSAINGTAPPLTSGPGLVLRIKGMDYGGWTAVRVRRSVEEASSQWACAVSERWPGQTEPWRIRPGDPCTVLLDGVVVISGYVFGYAPSFDGHTHRVEVRGRSRTADVVDSAVVLDSGQLKGLTLARRARPATHSSSAWRAPPASFPHVGEALALGATNDTADS